MGRPRKPTPMKVIHGDFEKNPQRENKQEPKVPPGTPKIPDHLVGHGKKEWGRVTKELLSMGVLTKVDRQAVEQYCVAYHSWRDAMDDVKKNGLILLSADKYGQTIHKRNPADVACIEYSRLIHKYLCEFGLTPSSRSRLVVTQETDTRSELARKYLG